MGYVVQSYKFINGLDPFPNLVQIQNPYPRKEGSKSNYSLTKGIKMSQFLKLNVRVGGWLMS